MCLLFGYLFFSCFIHSPWKKHLGFLYLHVPLTSSIGTQLKPPMLRFVDAFTNFKLSSSCSSSYNVLLKGCWNYLKLFRISSCIVCALVLSFLLCFPPHLFFFFFQTYGAFTGSFFFFSFVFFFWILSCFPSKMADIFWRRGYISSVWEITQSSCHKRHCILCLNREIVIVMWEIVWEIYQHCYHTYNRKCYCNWYALYPTYNQIISSDLRFL